MNNPEVVERLETASANHFCGPWRIGEAPLTGSYEVRTEVPDGRTAAVAFTVDNDEYAKKPEWTIARAIMDVETALENLIEKHPKQS